MARNTIQTRIEGRKKKLLALTTQGKGMWRNNSIVMKEQPERK